MSKSRKQKRHHMDDGKGKGKRRDVKPKAGKFVDGRKWNWQEELDESSILQG